MGDITNNFSYHEFRPHGADRQWTPNSQYQKLLVDMLAKQLQVVRSKMDLGSWMRVTSGVRTLLDYKRLKSLGYHPSETSDHNFGFAVPLSKTNRKYKKFGYTYNFSVGAADIVPVNMDAKDLFELAVELSEKGLCSFSQIIYEENPRTGSKWVHFGNSHKLFRHNITMLINRTKYLQTMDGGYTYQKVRV